MTQWFCDIINDIYKQPGYEAVGGGGWGKEAEAETGAVSNNEGTVS